MSNSNAATGPQLRVRLTMTEGMRNTADELGAVLDLPDAQVLLFALSLGLRFLQINTAGQMGLTMSKELQSRGDAEARAVFADAGIKPRG